MYYLALHGEELRGEVLTWDRAWLRGEVRALHCMVKGLRGEEGRGEGLQVGGGLDPEHVKAEAVDAAHEDLEDLMSQLNSLGKS